jgi:hypothetical protein
MSNDFAFLDLQHFPFLLCVLVHVYLTFCFAIFKIWYYNISFFKNYDANPFYSVILKLSHEDLTIVPEIYSKPIFFVVEALTLKYSCFVWIYVQFTLLHFFLIYITYINLLSLAFLIILLQLFILLLSLLLILLIILTSDKFIFNILFKNNNK